MQTDYKMATWNAHTNELREWDNADSVLEYWRATAAEQRFEIWGLTEYAFVDADTMAGIGKEELLETGWQRLSMFISLTGEWAS